MAWVSCEDKNETTSRGLKAPWGWCSGSPAAERQAGVASAWARGLAVLGRACRKTGAIP